MTALLEHTYRYRGASDYDAVARTLALATDDDGRDESARAPMLFDGYVMRPEQTAAALLVVAAVARTRFWSPPGMVAAALRAADPVITAGGGMLRFESFSPCCGVGARLDLLPSGLETPVDADGTTNVDFNPDMRTALARVGGLDPLHVRIGRDVTVRTLDATVTEKRVPLPRRWIRGFGEAQIAAARMERVLTAPPTALRDLLRGLPRVVNTRATPFFVVRSGAALRITSRPGGAPLAGPQRLQVLEPLIRYATAIHVDAAPDLQGGSVWRLDLPGARFTLALSADLGQGFSGEGGLLHDLTQLGDDALESAAAIERALREPDQTADSLTALRLSAPDGFTALAASGRIGWDGAQRVYYSRPLPFDPDGADALDAPRLADARELVRANAVRFLESDPDRASITSAGTAYAVRLHPDHTELDTCTCPWYGRHRGTRGPCKHVLAARLARRQAEHLPR